MNSREAAGRQAKGCRFAVSGWMVTALAALLLAGGCSGFRGSSEASAPGALPAGPVLLAAERPPIVDVPIPAGFRLVKGNSWSRHFGELRNIHHEYRGLDDTHDVARFYTDQMPAGTWRLASSMERYGEYAILFENRVEFCFIKITKSWFFGLFKYVTVEISPKPLQAKSVQVAYPASR